jgi:hypothetical protein
MELYRILLFMQDTMCELWSKISLFTVENPLRPEKSRSRQRSFVNLQTQSIDSFRDS